MERIQLGASMFLMTIVWSAPVTLPAAATPNVILWDTGAPWRDQAEAPDRSSWQRVPTDLLALEADPPKASSDPGYYGREYAFKGDAVVENRSLAAVFSAAKGRLILYARTNALLSSDAAGDGARWGRKILEFAPPSTGAQPGRIVHCGIIRNGGDEVALQVSFSGQEGKRSAIFGFGKSEIVEIKPGEGMKSARLFSPIQYGIIPSFVGDDLIFQPSEYPSVKSLSLPSENCFIGLLEGQDAMVVLTWPKGRQQLRLGLQIGKTESTVAGSVELDNDGQSFYLAPLTAPGIWHREVLQAAHLEKEVALNHWQRPFPAKWKTQLTEGQVRTTFTFRPSKGEIWRGVPGSYRYPVWFEGEEGFMHLSKKIPPKGEAVIYFLEGQETPPSISTPVDILKATLGRAASEPILDIAGRKLQTHHRRDEGVHRACTCGYTEAIQAIFESGQETARKQFVKDALDDMVYFVEQHVKRIEEYRRFADDLLKFFGQKKTAAPELKSYLDPLEETVQRIPEEYRVQKENMKSLEYAGELLRQTMDLTKKTDPGNLKLYLELLKAWRAMGGAQDYVVAQCHAITRKLAQEAGYGCATQPKAVALAEEIRRRCRECLRSPDGYEIWAEY